MIGVRGAPGRVPLCRARGVGVDMVGAPWARGVGIDMVGAPWAVEAAKGDEVVGVADMVVTATALQGHGEATVREDLRLDISKVCNH